MKTLAILLPLVAILTGCSTVPTMSDADVQLLFDTSVTLLRERLAEQPDEITGDATGTTTPTSSADTASDEVDYSSLQWVYGGFNGAGASLDDAARISNLTFNTSTLYYKWLNSTGCEDLGATSSGDYNATLACVFFQKSDGTWVGGKFDWISTSRTSRGLDHCSFYSGWTLDGIPNPCPAAFVIVSVETGTRSNVIKGEWKR